MFRALVELIITVLVVVVARAILTSVLRGIANSSGAFRRSSDSLKSQGTAPSSAQTSGELHRDPVCGTYVAESTPFRRQIGGQTFYYCSDACREKHAVLAH